jgi:hypothetical protein
MVLRFRKVAAVTDTSATAAVLVAPSALFGVAVAG